jgi:hypothetical protein
VSGHEAMVGCIYRGRPALVDACGLGFGDPFELALAAQLVPDLRSGNRRVPFRNVPGFVPA